MHQGSVPTAGRLSLRVHLRWMVPAILVASALVLPLQPLALRQGLAAGVLDGTATPATSGTPAPTATSPSGPTPVAEPTPPRHYVVLFVVDADSTAYFTLTKLPHIRALMSRGAVYDRAWVGEMESSTPNVHVTLGTGTLPRENGFLGFGWAAPQTRETIDFRTLLANRAIDPVLQALPVPGIAARLHQYMPNAVSVASSGHKDYAVVGLGGGAATYELYGKAVKNQFLPTFLHLHGPPPLSTAERRQLTVPLPLAPGKEDSWAIQYAVDVVRHVRPKLLMINLPDLDTYGHWYGPESRAVFQQLALNVDQGIGRIEATYDDLGLLDRTDFILTADHAMMESRAARNWSAVQDMALGAHTRSVRADGEGGSIWLQDPTQAKVVAERIVAMHPAHVQAVFYRSASGIDYTYLQASPTSWVVNQHVIRALQDLVNTTAGRNGPDIWVLYRENYTVVPRNVAGTWKGTHGGPTWKVQHIPLILAGPGIRSGVHLQFPARSVDVTPTIEYLLGLPAVHRDGVLLADALLHPTRSELNAQLDLAPSLSADVGALRAQSVADDRAEQISRWPTPSPVLRCSFAPAVSIPPQHPCTITPKAATNQ